MTVEAICHAKHCGRQATTVCEACGRPYCPNHMRELALERRDDSAARPGHRAALGRVPTRTETYLLCLRSRSKPFVGIPRHEHTTPSSQTR